MPAGQKLDPFKPSMLKLCLPLALTGIATNLFCFAAGIQRTVPAHSSNNHAMIPVGVLLIGMLLLRERQRPLALLGMAVAIAGALYVVRFDQRVPFSQTIVGDLITLVGALAFSTYVVLGRRIIPQAGGAWRAVTTGYLISVPIAIPFLIWGLVNQDWSMVTWKGWAGTAYMTFGATFFCYSAHMWCLTHLEPLQVSVFVDVQPMLAAAISAILGIEAITGDIVIGGLVAVAGVALVQVGSAPQPAAKKVV
jgi:drug/metabolite transporter (DMT)-like permease